jgi:hypothetical protein
MKHAFAAEARGRLRLFRLKQQGNRAHQHKVPGFIWKFKVLIGGPRTVGGWSGRPRRLHFPYGS